MCDVSTHTRQAQLGHALSPRQRLWFVVGANCAAVLEDGEHRTSSARSAGRATTSGARRIGWAAKRTTTSVPNLAPFGSRRKLFGNNPIVWTFPRRHDAPIVLDMAMTPVALGKVLRARSEGNEIPVEWGFLDRDGNKPLVIRNNGFYKLTLSSARLRKHFLIINLVKALFLLILSG